MIWGNTFLEIEKNYYKKKNFLERIYTNEKVISNVECIGEIEQYIFYIV